MKKEYSVNKYQFGAIMPTTKAAAFEYKPLGLEAFARPLAAKQQKFDNTFDTVDKTVLGVDGTSADKERAAEISLELKGYKDDILKDLQQSGNYKQASRKLSKLNSLYNTHPESSGIRSTKIDFAKKDAIEKKRIDGEKYTQDDYDKWKFKALNEYTELGGFSYDSETGNFNTIDTTPSGNNLEKEFIDKSIEYAKTAATQETVDINSLSGMIPGITEDQAKLLKTTIKTKDLNTVSQEIFNLMKQSDRYKNWLEEKAEKDFYYDVRKYPQSNLIENAIQKQENTLKGQIDRMNDIISNPNESPERKNKAQKIKENTESNLQAYEVNLQNASSQGRLKEFAQATHVQNVMNNWMQDTTKAATDIYDLREEGASVFGGSSDGGTTTTKNDDILEDLKQVNLQSLGTNPNDTPLTGRGAVGNVDPQNTFTTTTMGDQTKLYDDIRNFQKNQPENKVERKIDEKRNNIIVGRDVGVNAVDGFGNPIEIDYKNAEYINSKEFNSEYDPILKDTQLSNSLSNRYNEKWGKLIADKEAEVEQLKVNIGNTTNQNEKTALKEKIRLTNQDIGEDKLGRLGEYYTITSQIDQIVQQNLPENSWVAEAFKTGGYSEVLKKSYDINLENLEDFATSQGIDGGVPYNAPDGRKFYLQSPDGGNVEMPSVENGGLIMGKENTLIFNPDTYLNSVVSADFEKINNPLNKISNDWVTNMAVLKAPQVEAITTDADANLYVGDAFKVHTDRIKNEAAGAEGAAQQIYYNGGTGETELVHLNKTDDNYDLTNYNEIADFIDTEVGADGSTRVIYRYNRGNLDETAIKKQILSNASITPKAKQQWKDLIENYDDGDYDVMSIARYKRENPKNLYLSLSGNSDDIETNANLSVTKFGKAAIENQNPYAFNMAINNYATITNRANNTRGKNYLEKAISMGKALENKDSNSKIIEPPAAWKKVSRAGEPERHIGYKVDYAYNEKRKGIVASVAYTTVDGEGTTIPNAEGNDYTYITDYVMSGIQASDFRVMDIMWGVGSERDLIKDPITNANFVPAFESQNFATALNK
tara:strand:- start:31068 stop:34211 length:3144 start_codon:yes stop_codon:yes gene_type:complete